jgi:hypothetical protein
VPKVTENAEAAMSENGTTHDWRDLPQPVREAVQKAEAGVADLQAIANAIGLKRKFTLDGRLVGDIGELLLCPDFKVLPGEKPNGHAHDLIGESLAGRVQVQVKLRRRAKGGRLEFKYQPECLVFIECSDDWSRWRIVYNGPGNVVTEPGIEVRPDDCRILLNGEPHLVYLTRARLEAAATAILPTDICLAARIH